MVDPSSSFSSRHICQIWSPLNLTCITSKHTYWPIRMKRNIDQLSLRLWVPALASLARRSASDSLRPHPRGHLYRICIWWCSHRAILWLHRRHHRGHMLLWIHQRWYLLCHQLWTQERSAAWTCQCVPNQHQQMIVSTSLSQADWWAPDRSACPPGLYSYS